ncbi:3-hydroxyacyl-CoA dehydrogenase [Streptomyces mobaraensis NBRC 13819 = DSM 40847]|uniref:3-hydroxy-acyl-CoA dehydrogenase n=1 Tax=Streptomyces mobaraensis (strain ATCC 29032 / DSM 40847 / JCM 4168 / NBRC 13819 / NCIMB 11159 / IPCR 16-22) TaxID=1223523 RepID=M3CCV8_STRM1|nr:3-hydroxyacyl-CoA dehydrogenase [Streptomyces mobaraensis]EMF01836.1 3-hydroxy-acyl-CoA dehydrogenase [Streptomyces mobaraensis NBRC 13819 = DSM 40847]QTT74658.1 3-hydroxyacyl-CoA dehydrogenase [Streptomyces mobaraensis NBRC 13819 = DSM 40847]
MTAIEPEQTVSVVGAGTMGQGIAQVALVAGHPVRLYDALPGRAEEAARAVAARLDRLVAKGRMPADARDAAVARLRPVAEPAGLAGSALVVEAVVERLDVKQRLFGELEEVVDDDCLLATNTSSLPVTAVAGPLRRPGRLVGLHFFNPAPLLPLVEVVRGHATDTAAADRAYATAAAWGKTPVRCADTPGFIVNRLARPFYAEAFRLLEEWAADPATIDAVLRESGGFAMGPFELTDLIGQDVNEAVTRSVYEAFFHHPKFTPSLAQRRLVEAGLLGRKSGRGWYDHAEGAARPEPHTAAPEKAPGALVLHGALPPAADVLPELVEAAGIALTRAEADGDGYFALPGGARLALTDGRSATGDAGEPAVRFDLALDYRSCSRVALAASAGAAADDLRAAVGLFQALGKKVSVVADAPGLIVARTVALLVDLAEDAAGRDVAAPEDIDTAMRLGVNYPRGPLEWGRELGSAWVRRFLANMEYEYPGGRYAPSQPLRRRAAAAVKESLLPS